MRCPIETHENAELLLAYCARKLDPENTAILDRHIANCPACQEFQRSQQAVWDALDTWELMPVSRDFDRRLYRRIDEEANSSWWNRLARPLRPVLVGRGVPLAAAACLIMVAGVLFERPANVGVVPEEMSAQVETIQADQVERTLEDMEMLRQFKLATTSDSGSSM